MGVPSHDQKLGRLDELRQRVLVGAPVDPPSIDTASEYLAGMPLTRFAAAVLSEGRGRPLIQPRGGFARFEDQRRLSHALSDAGADFIPLTVDSHTRQNEYETAGVLLERSILEDQNLLNGYPLVNHGFALTRSLFTEIDRPISLRHGTPDARLLVETALASGITEVEGGALCYTLPYTRSYPITRALMHWQYVDRLCAVLSTRGRIIHRESFGVLTATLVPPFLVVVTEILELLLAAEQGVQSFSLSFAQTGSALQDSALAKVLREAASDYLRRFDFSEPATYLVYHQWMGAFPIEYELADALIATSAQTAALLGVDKIVTKTREEARGIPSLENNAAAVRTVAYIMDRVDRFHQMDDQQVVQEAARIRREADYVLDAIFELPPDTLAHSIAIAVEKGIIDVPFSPHEDNCNALIARRGAHNGVYVEHAGLVPFPAESLEEERDLLRAGQGLENRTLYQSLLHDINFMADVP